MSKRSKRREKQRRQRARQVAAGAMPAAAPTAPQRRQAGMRALAAGRYAEAIDAWSTLDTSSSDVTRALAEAHFRLAAALGPIAESLPHLERAVELLPSDPLYRYALGLALHRRGQLAEALAAYRRALADGLPPQRAGKVMALATLGLDPQADLSGQPGLTTPDRRALEPVAALLRGAPAAEQTPSLLGRLAGSLPFGQPPASQALLSALQLLAAGGPAEARQALERIKGLLPQVDAVRWYYAGVASARVGEWEPAIAAWQKALHLAPELSGLQENLRAAIAEEYRARAEASDWTGAARAAREGLEALQGDATLGTLALAALDRVAHDAARAGDWKQAARRWEEARRVLGQVRGGGTPRPILHNLALAYEALERWPDAAEAWRAMLRTRPRKRVDDGFSEAHWGWVRRHVIDLYKRTGQPGEAVAVFRQALKADPGDVDMQLGLAQALLANEQEQAAMGELQRLLARQPAHVPALTALAELHAGREDWHAAEDAMRRAVRAEPGDPALRRRLADVLLERADQATDYGRYSQARALLQETMQLAPDDYRPRFTLARVEFSTRHQAEARRHLERGLELGRGQPDAYQEAIVAWISQENADEARAMTARAEAEAVLPPSFFMYAGLAALVEASPSQPAGMRTLLGPPQARPRRKAAEAMAALGQELLERAIAMGPQVAMLRAIVLELGPMRAHLALPYARRLTEITPEDAVSWLLLGLCLGMEGQAHEAQDAARQAARLARRQGNREVAGAADELRRGVADPMFPVMMSMARAFEEEEAEFA